MFDLIQKTDRGLAVIERGLVIALTAAIACVMMAQVVLRYFFSAPIFWAEEISVQMLVFATLFGLSLLVHHGRLVTIDFLPQALPARARHGLIAALGVVMLALFAFVAWLGWEWIARPEVRIELGATTQLPRWYNYAVLPFALTLMGLHHFAAILRDARACAGGRK
ncbi:TRAP transporter small permease [Aromatoleum sp.]|uniref:TRAP transporter small permease n=1 Tax=Aromatoleum sp. TaxID=2307007 RepID=UPI002FC808F6